MIDKLVKKLLPDEGPEAIDAIDLLKADHREVEALFAEFEAADDKRTKHRIASQICAALDVHAQIEEKIFYPAVKKAVEDVVDDINEGIVEHQSIKRLVKEIPKLSASDDFFEPRVTVLKEYVQHHVKEEEKVSFPKIRDGEIDLKALGQKLQQRKLALQQKSRGTTRSASATRARTRNGSASHASSHR